MIFVRIRGNTCLGCPAHASVWSEIAFWDRYWGRYQLSQQLVNEGNDSRELIKTPPVVGRNVMTHPQIGKIHLVDLQNDPVVFISQVCPLFICLL